ncbi:hypothetical protein BN14_03241 [Rhizoctonia solani AG-1 IB]|uniref:Chromo domain-containing protein n=1 Tax=Thanatephorus cucumeris (strain AG1-IB / isolate 7/3/14) TaxID=1108050 RepID=M5BQ45_THACB|nr:hypothetical protein BN14_03241 [Rhizoctonia solani AG-1 IB]
MATSPKNKGRASKKAKEVVEEHEEESGSGSEEDEEGYEVEAILDAKWQYNKRGKWSYFVRWKGYGPEDDLWIDEEDAGGSEDLIKEYHETNNLPRDGKGKKGPVKKGRPSATAQKKRKASVDEMEVDEEEAPKKQTKRGRPSKNKEPEPKSDAEEEEEEAEPEFASMDDYMKKAKWNDLIKEIETVENTGDGELIALVTRADGQKARVSTTVLAERCPQKASCSSLPNYSPN